MPKHERPVEAEPAQTVHDVQITVADAGGDGAYQHLAAARAVEVHGLDGQRLVHFPKHGGGDLHESFLLGFRRLTHQSPMHRPAAIPVG